jgi:hypothetical protein
MTLLREPIDRMVSHYFFVKQDKGNYLHDRVMKSEIGLEDYANSKLSDELQNWYTTHFTGWSAEDVESHPEEALRLAVKIVRQRYDIIGFQDDLTSAAEKLKDAANLRQPFVNQVRNSTRDRMGVQEIAESERNAIARANAVDIKLFSLLKSSGADQATDLESPTVL